MDPAEIRRAAEEVLSHPDYRLSTEPEKVPSWLTELSDGVTEWLKGPAGWIAEALRDLSPWGRSLAAVFLLAVVVLVVVTVVRRSRRLRREDRSFVESEDSSETLAKRFESLADEAAQRNDYAEGVRWLLKASVVRLEAAEQRIYRPGTTNRELLRRYDSNRVREPVRQLVETMDATWYGRRDCTIEDFAECSLSATEIRKLVKTRLRPAIAPHPRSPIKTANR